MSNNKILFKRSIKKLTEVRDNLAISNDKPGQMIFLCDNNQKALKASIAKLEDAINILREIN